MIVAALTLLLQPAKPVQLFNGKDLSGWHMDVPELDKNPEGTKPFIVRDGTLVSLGNPGGHLITDKVYENYKLEVQYRFTKQPGNCGVLVHASKPRTLYGMFPKSIEVQLQSGDAGDFWCIGENIEVPDFDMTDVGAGDTACGPVAKESRGFGHRDRLLASFKRQKIAWPDRKNCDISQCTTESS